MKNKEYRAMKRRLWKQQPLSRKLATIWVWFFFGGLALGITATLLGAIIYAYIDLGFYHAMPLTVGIVVTVTTLLAIRLLED